MNTPRVDGKVIADEILERLREEVSQNHLHPKLVVILVGNNPASLSYIKQKQHAAERIGAAFELVSLPESVTPNEFSQTLEKYNKDPLCHGIIIQRPLPTTSTISPEQLLRMSPKKDIDGFVPNSPFDVPVAKAVVTILEKIFYQLVATSDFVLWLRQQEIIVIGKGETAGKPIAKTLEKLSVPVIVVDRSTPDPHQLMKKADILIACVGKEQFVKAEYIKKQSIVISVGISRGNDGKLHGDFEEEEIKEKVLAYTPTPGGVGPVNVACLMQNLVEASKVE